MLEGIFPLIKIHRMINVTSIRNENFVEKVKKKINIHEFKIRNSDILIYIIYF